jgi:hypothetical protein
MLQNNDIKCDIKNNNNNTEPYESHVIVTKASKNMNINRNNEETANKINKKKSVNQIFIKTMPISILYNVLNIVGEKYDNYYKISKVSYKKADYYNKLDDLIETIKPYYCNSKKHFVERRIDYVKFITILRQLCNHFNFYYDSKMIYNNSNYEIDYYIYEEMPSLQ